MRLISAGSLVRTSGASIQAVRSVNGSPWRARARRGRAWTRRSSAVGRTIHSTVCSAAGSLGPGGSSGMGQYEHEAGAAGFLRGLQLELAVHAARQLGADRAAPPEAG